jgi:hypothetical protein
MPEPMMVHDKLTTGPTSDSFGPSGRGTSSDLRLNVTQNIWLYKASTATRLGGFKRRRSDVHNAYRIIGKGCARTALWWFPRRRLTEVAEYWQASLCPSSFYRPRRKRRFRSVDKVLYIDSQLWGSDLSARYEICIRAGLQNTARRLSDSRVAPLPVGFCTAMQRWAPCTTAQDDPGTGSHWIHAEMECFQTLRAPKGGRLPLAPEVAK